VITPTWAKMLTWLPTFRSVAEPAGYETLREQHVAALEAARSSGTVKAKDTLAASVEAVASALPELVPLLESSRVEVAAELAKAETDHPDPNPAYRSDVRMQFQGEREALEFDDDGLRVLRAIVAAAVPEDDDEGDLAKSIAAWRGEGAPVE
jgi:hypothetical protein